MTRSAGEKSYDSVGFVGNNRNTHACTVVLQSGGFCHTNNLWSSKDTGCREHFNQTTDKFNDNDLMMTAKVAT